MKSLFGKGLLIAAGLLFLVGTANAGTAHVNHGAQNSPIIVALEGMGANKAVTIAAVAAGSGSNNSPVSFDITQTLTSQNLIQVTFANGGFGAGLINVCAKNGAADNIIIGQGTPGAGTVTYNFQLGANADAAGTNLKSGDYLWLGVGGASCDIAAANNFPMIIPATNVAVVPTVTISAITAGNLPVDLPSTVNAANVTPEFSAALTTRNLTIDYLGAASNTGAAFTNSNFAGNNVAVNAVALNITRNAVNVTTVGGGANFGLTAAAVINFDADTNWQGVSRVWASNNAALADASNSNIVAAPNGAVALNVSAAGFNGGDVPAAPGNAAQGIRIEVPGNVELAPRTITGSYDINITGGNHAQDPGPVAGTWQVWTTNGYQAFVPHMRFADNINTFLRVVNNSGVDAVMVGTATEPDGTQYANLALGTVAANSTVSLSASAIAGIAGIVGDAGDFALAFTVRTNADNIFTNCFMNLLSGGVWTTRDDTVYDSAKTNFGLK